MEQVENYVAETVLARYFDETVEHSSSGLCWNVAIPKVMMYFCYHLDFRDFVDCLWIVVVVSCFFDLEN